MYRWRGGGGYSGFSHSWRYSTVTVIATGNGRLELGGAVPFNLDNIIAVFTP